MFDFPEIQRVQPFSIEPHPEAEQSYNLCLDILKCHQSVQIMATSHDQKPQKVAEVSGDPLISRISRLVKHYNLARLIFFSQLFLRINNQMWHINFSQLSSQKNHQNHQIFVFLVAKTHQKKTVQFSSNFLKKVGHAVHDAVTGCPKDKLDSWEDHGSMIVVLQAAAGLEEDHVRFVGGRLNQR